MWRLVVVALGLAGCRFGFELRIGGGDDVSPGDDANIGGGDGGDGANANGWTYLIANDQTTCGIAHGRAYCWGRGTNREIGDGIAMDRPSPTAVALPPGTVTAIAQGEGHGCAILDGVLYCWGNAPPGTGTPTATMPVAVTSLPSPVTSVGAGLAFTCAVAASATYCWGSDGGGQIGNGAGGSTTTPSLVTLQASTVSISVGNDHVIALLSDGTVWAWGHNASGAFGTGSMTPANAQTPVQALVTGVQPRLAGWHACAIVNSGAQCWGMGTMGELGDGASTSSASPVNVNGMTSGVTVVATGGGPSDFDASCAMVTGVPQCGGN